MKYVSITNYWVVKIKLHYRQVCLECFSLITKKCPIPRHLLKRVVEFEQCQPYGIVERVFGMINAFIQSQTCIA